MKKEAGKGSLNGNWSLISFHEDTYFQNIHFHEAYIQDSSIIS